MDANARAVRKVLWVTLALNVGVAVAKLAYGLKSGLLAMSADGVHSLLDGGANVIGLVAVSAAFKPPDTEHPYGHRKFETFAALSIGVLMLLASYEILREAVSRILDPAAHEPVVNALGFVIMLVTMAVNIGVSIYERREGERLHSDVLIADSAHTRSDVLVSLSVIGALGAALLGWGLADVLASLFIVVWIGRIAWQVVKPAMATLADEARLDPAALDALAMDVAGVRDVHRIRTRGHADAIFVDLHVQVDPRATVSEAHRIAHLVETSIKGKFPRVVDVVTHLEPHGDPVEGLDGNIVGPPR